MTSVEQSYKQCRKLNFRFGSTYFWATCLLSNGHRKHVYALYAFCRYIDDIVDVDDGSVASHKHSLDELETRFFADLDAGYSTHHVFAAVVDTVNALGIDPECFRRFMKSMRMDLTQSTYETFDDLLVYMDGSAAVIGEMMLPILQPDADATEPARNLGIAFQLTNFLRDVGEDLDRGRVYIPQETLRCFGSDPWQRHVTPEWRNAMRYEIQRTRTIYRNADAGIDMLPARSARCVSAARRMYSGILERIEHNDYNVFTHRARVPYWRKVKEITATKELKV